mgnify:CR=1 FL=1
MMNLTLLAGRLDDVAVVLIDHTLVKVRTQAQTDVALCQDIKGDLSLVLELRGDRS